MGSIESIVNGSHLTWQEKLFLLRAKDFERHTGRALLEADFYAAFNLARMRGVKVTDALDFATNPDTVELFRLGLMPWEAESANQGEQQLLARLDTAQVGTNSDYDNGAGYADLVAEQNLAYRASRRRAREINRRHFQRERSRHPKTAEFYRKRSRQKYSDMGDTEDRYGINGTNQFLRGLGFTSQDVTLMELAYGQRLVKIADEDIDLVKAAIGEFFTDEVLDRYIPGKTNRKLRSDFISYLEVLHSTWSNFGPDMANRFVEKEDMIGLTGLAVSNYERRQSALTDSGVKTVDRKIRFVLEASVNLIARHVLRRDISPLEVNISLDVYDPVKLGALMPPRLRGTYSL